MILEIQHPVYGQMKQTSQCWTCPFQLGRCAIFQCWMPVHVRTVGILSKMSQLIISPLRPQEYINMLGVGRAPMVEARWAHQHWLLHDWRQTLMSLTPASTLTSPLSREQALISASCGSREDRLDPQDESYEGNRETWDVKEPSGAFHFPVWCIRGGSEWAV